MDKIVAISDLHLGQTGADGFGQYSLLSSKAPENLVDKFAEAVRQFAKDSSITLLVTGDFLDLSLAYMAEALEDFKNLLASLRDHKVSVREIVYLVGNHDQHMWSLHSEDTRLLQYLRTGNIPPLDPTLPANMAMYHTTTSYGETFTLLQPLVDEIFQSKSTSIQIAYPSFQRQLPNNGPLIYGTHGHLMGGLYTALSRLLADRLQHLPPDRVAATVNQPIIEFIYWLLGETGEGMGADGLLEQIYTDSQKGVDSTLQDVVSHGVKLAVPKGTVPLLPTSWEQAWITKAIMSKLDAAMSSPAASAHASAARHADVESTREQLWAWVHTVPALKARLPSVPIHVLYGHTHVWDKHQFLGTNMIAWNLNTWLVEPGHEVPRTGFLAIDSDCGEVEWVDVK